MNDDDFKNLIKGIREAEKVKRGEKRASRVFKFNSNDIKNLRKNLGLSQSEFSRLVFVNISTIQNWEQGRRQPQGPALALLMILKKDPKHALQALNSSE